MYFKQPMTLRRILAWADRHRDRTGRWPISRSGPVLDADDGTTWEGVNTALTKGIRGLSGGDSLARLLQRRRTRGDARSIWPELSRRKILDWVDEYYQRTSRWPQRDSGSLAWARDITWATIDRHLKKGNCSLPGGSSLSALLREARGIDAGKVPLTEARITRWARQHHDETGRWPVTLSGKVRGRPGEDWAAIDMALRHTRRGLTRTTSLSRLLTEHARERYNPRLGPISISQIVEWARRHHRSTGRWPTHRTGPVRGMPRLKWSSIDYALRLGGRGLPGGTTLARLLDEHVRHGLCVARLSEAAS